MLSRALVLLLLGMPFGRRRRWTLCIRTATTSSRTLVVMATFPVADISQSWRWRRAIVVVDSSSSSRMRMMIIANFLLLLGSHSKLCLVQAKFPNTGLRSSSRRIMERINMRWFSIVIKIRVVTVVIRVAVAIVDTCSHDQGVRYACCKIWYSCSWN